MSSATFHTSLAIELHSFAPIPFVAHPNSRAADASPDGVRAPLPTSDCYTDRFAEHRDFAADALAAPGADFEPADAAANALAVALTSVGFVDLRKRFPILIHFYSHSQHSCAKRNCYEFRNDISIEKKTEKQIQNRQISDEFRLFLRIKRRC